MLCSPPASDQGKQPLWVNHVKVERITPYSVTNYIVINV